MADDTAFSAGHPDMDYAAHEATYAFFIKLMKGIAVGVVCILVFLAFMWG